jgi:hypothetical protein
MWWSRLGQGLEKPIHWLPGISGISLLADGLPLRSIVAITFTRKAGREMRNRIREKIRCYYSVNYETYICDGVEYPQIWANEVIIGPNIQPAGYFSNPAKLKNQP